MKKTIVTNLIISILLVSCWSEKCKIDRINKNSLGFYSGQSDILVKNRTSKIIDTVFLSNFEEVKVDYSENTPLKDLECHNALVYSFNFKNDYIYLNLTYKKDFKILDITTNSLVYSKKFTNVEDLRNPIYLINDTLKEKDKIKKLVFVNGKFTSITTGDNSEWIPVQTLTR